MAEKDEEFEATRVNHQRSMESMEASLEAETRGRTESTKMKKKLEHDIGELEVALDTANRIRSEQEKNAKKFQQQMLEFQAMVSSRNGNKMILMYIFIKVEDEKHQKDQIRDQVTMTERKMAMMFSELEEVRSSLENSERNRKNVENEKVELSDRLNELNVQSSGFLATKRKLEADLGAMQVERSIISLRSINNI